MRSPTVTTDQPVADPFGNPSDNPLPAKWSGSQLWAEFSAPVPFCPFEGAPCSSQCPTWSRACVEGEEDDR